MSFTGDLHTFDLFDLLSWALNRRKGGLLELSRRSTTKKLGLREGAVHWSTSNDPRETIGQTLVRDGLITEEALFGALLKQETDRRRLGEILVGDGHLAQEKLLECLRANAEAQLYDAFLWPDGRFSFEDHAAQRPQATDLAVALRPVLDEGRHRRERWAQLRRRFPTNELTFRLIRDPVGLVDPGLRQIADLAAWGRTLAAISLETRRSEYETTLLLEGLCDDGYLEAGRVEAGAPEADPVAVIRAQLSSAAMRIKEGRFDAAIEAYERVLGLDRVNQEAKKGLLAVAEARRRARAASRIPLEAVPVLRLTAVTLAQQHFAPEEGFVLSRINGQWDVRSILKLCPLPEDETIAIFSRLLDKKVIGLG
ncbi:MAG: DUF4388 domain-containing protein [Vicinamibacteria bacterium]